MIAIRRQHDKSIEEQEPGAGIEPGVERIPHDNDDNSNSSGGEEVYIRGTVADVLQTARRQKCILLMGRYEQSGT